MKKFILPLITFILGIVLGATVLWFKFLIPAGKSAQWVYASSAESKVDTAFQLRFGGADTFLKNFQFNLPSDVQTLHHFETLNYNNNNTQPALTILRTLRKIKAYYTATGLSIPTNVAGVLNALPPQTVTAEDWSQSKSTLTKAGEISPIFSVYTIDGQKLDFQGRVVVVNFFATWCGPCMNEMPSLEKGVWDQFKTDILAIILDGFIAASCCFSA